jgi:4-hydroxybenzoate polyprenyltransferase
MDYGTPQQGVQTMASGWGKGGAYMGLAFVIPISMAVCYYVGDYLATGWGGTVGLVIGFAAGLYESYRQAMILEKPNEPPNRKNPEDPEGKP